MAGCHRISTDHTGQGLACAAQFVGSALLNSARSAVLATLSGSGGSLSTNLSSIPTSPSVVPSVAMVGELSVGKTSFGTQLLCAEVAEESIL
jgi:hypothetical protein